jgi:4'-phosphopantetheinyl transferase
MMNLESKLQRQRFFDLWTLKESYIKARGKGLAIPLKSFGFRFTKDNNILLDEQVKEAGHWRFWQLDDTEKYKLAVALRGTAALPEKKLVVKELVNFSQSRNADLRLLRTGS